VIHRRSPNNYVGLEYKILECFGIARQVQWEVVKQHFFSHNGRKLDQIVIKTRQDTSAETITTTEAHYFDITECF
jgi:hypothetical protein